MKTNVAKNIYKEKDRFGACSKESGPLRPGDVYYVNFGPYNKHIQGGERPAIILGISNILRYSKSLIVQVVPLTSKSKFQDIHVKVNANFLKMDSYAVPEQITTINVSDLENFKGRLDQEEFDKVKKAVHRQLGL